MNKISSFFTVLLGLVAVLALLPGMALAAPPTQVWVGETNVTTGYETEKSLTSSSGKVTYASGVLTLNGVQYTGSGHYLEYNKAAGIYANGDLKIVLVNDNYVGVDSYLHVGANNDRHGVLVEGTLTVSGTGRLEASCNAGESAHTFGVRIDGNLEISEGTLLGIGNNADSCYGIYSLYNISVSGTATLSGTAGTDGGNERGAFGVAALRIAVSGGTLTGTAKRASLESMGVRSDPYGVTVSGGALTGVSTNNNSSAGKCYGVYSPGSTLTGGTIIAQKGTGVATGAFSSQPGFGTENWYIWRLADSGAYTESSAAASYTLALGNDYVEITDNRSVSGVISGSDTGAGLVGASVQLKKGAANVGSAVTTGAGGAFTITGVPADMGYTLEASCPGYDNGATAAFDVAGSNVTGKNISLTKITTRSVSGVISGSDTGAGLVGASVQLKKGTANVGSAVTTGAGGAFTITGVPADTGYTLEASCPGYDNGVTAAFDVAGSDVTGINITLAKLTLSISVSPSTTFPVGASGGPRVVTIVGGTTAGTLGVANLGGVDMDGTPLTAGNEFTASNGSIVLTLNEAYFNTLPVGIHTLTARITSGLYSGQSPKVRFTVLSVSTPPKTGDNAAPLLWALLAALAGAGLLITGLVVFRKRH